MRQPSGSQIQLTSTVNRLEFKIPARFRPDREALHQIGVRQYPQSRRTDPHRADNLHLCATLNSNYWSSCQSGFGCCTNVRTTFDVMVIER